MADLTSFGIVSIDTALVEQFRLKKMVSVPDPVLKSDGRFHGNATSGEEWEGDANGKGSLPADFAVGGTGPTVDGLSDLELIVEGGDESQSIGQHAEWSATFTGFEPPSS